MPIFVVMLLLFACLPARAADNWLADALKAQTMQPPFRKTYYAGELLQINITKASALRLSIGDNADGGRVAVIPMKGSRRAGRKVTIDSAPVIFTQGTEEADTLAVKILSGKIDLEGDSERMSEIVIEEGQEGEIVVDPRHETISGRLINLSDYRSTITFRFMLNGEDVSNTSDRQRTLSLEFKGSSRAKTWKGGADKVIVKVHHGKIAFKAGHPFYDD
jgi:hypothetical protein